ncbi:MAG: Na/Pi cotransporter family protein [Faecalibacterium sp.]|nr:Na/Pi cotransporter family protein [Ruminococcus sp.]MCM1392522.1 Na/Pi cotransporter family protein [Ruminococcus sp.]MCM1485051.1 Na/Pi cotransporter family protein [Faecalibacterium sp.]
MSIFDILTFIGGLSMLLFGINYMGSALEKKAGGSLSGMIARFTSNKYTGFLLGLAATVVIQSSSATTVMVVGFVNSGIMTLTQSVSVIMGANVGTTVTAWILSLTGISGESVLVNLFKPTTFAPITAFIGVILYLFVKNSKKRDIGMILIGFSVLMFGMDTASNAVAGLSDVPGFAELFVLFKNPILGVLAGAILTAIIQSSTASVGILQALCLTGQVSVGAAFPIILGQNIGTCITTMISSFGANKNAKRAAMIHFNFNFLGSIILLILFYSLNLIFKFPFLDNAASAFDIAVIHTLCNIVVTAVFLPASSLLEKLSCKMVKDIEDEDNDKIILDERFFINPTVALEQAREKTIHMAEKSVSTFKSSINLIGNYSDDAAQRIISAEKRIDKYEDTISTYLVRLGSKELTENDSHELTTLLKVVGGFERLSDHAVHVVLSAKQVEEENLKFSPGAEDELNVIISAVFEIIKMTASAFCNNDYTLASQVEPLEQVIDGLIDRAKNGHIERMLKGDCTFQAGLTFADILHILERVSDHCSEIAASMIEISQGSLGVHGYLKEYRKKDNAQFADKYNEFKKKYTM